MTRKIKVLVGCAILVAAFSVCKVATDADDTGTRTVKSLRIEATEIQPWVEESDGFRTFANVGELTGIMNGGADEYYNRNAVDGFSQKMSNTISESVKYTVDCRVFDFGTSESALAMFAYKTEDVATKQSAGNLALTAAVIDPDASLTGCKGYAHFEQYFFELSYTGYGSNKTEATNNAASFIEVFKNKVTQK